MLFSTSFEFFYFDISIFFWQTQYIDTPIEFIFSKNVCTFSWENYFIRQDETQCLLLPEFSEAF